METVNLVGFITYFSDYYPVLIPSAIACCLLLAWFVDWLRIQIISYVDDGEGGPYKKYVGPALDRVCGNDMLYVGLAKTHYPYNYKYSWKLEGELMHLAIATKDTADIVDSNIKKFGKERYLTFLYSGGEVMPTPVKLTFYLLSLCVVLTAFKFLPAITVGVVVTYLILRVARSITRLTKKFNKHVADGHGAK